MSSGFPACEMIYSKLVDDNELQRRPDVEQSAEPVTPVFLTLRPSGPRCYRLATICLAALCAILLISIIAVTAHYKNGPQGGSREASEGTLQKQKQDANVSDLTATINKLQRENEELKAKLAAKLATKAPEPVRPTTKATAPPVICRQDWYLFNNSCYFISRSSKNWENSQQFCQTNGAHLAIIHTAEEQTFLWNLLPRGHWNAYWFGITDEHTEDQWKWVDGTLLVGGFWEDGEPNNHIDEDCGYIVKTRVLQRVAIRSWYDAPCTMFWPFICEKEMGGATNTTASH
ncbi:hepatic lectin-like [Thalassophryne amazonica]|uniref:hepatic lectin-like n=1 Tax=Thalassophryne amazonica TaxID=390379 RepID=UPI001471592A|nr:hepatic lectin-like [Thalassophryne amazonica]XP_034017194.1 hepatic lectin-like [Thalassophryne amazonica]